jgi:hypothetical protein
MVGTELCRVRNRKSQTFEAQPFTRVRIRRGRFGRSLAWPRCTRAYKPAVSTARFRLIFARFGLQSGASMQRDVVFMRSRNPVLLVGLLVLLVSGCRDHDVKSYRIPKEKVAAMPSEAPTPGPAAATPPASGAQPDMASTPVATAGGDGLEWSAPSDWQPRAGSAMRKGTYIITGTDGATAELAITAFPGDVGGDLANVNRWRNQLQLPPISAAELPLALLRFEANGLQVAVAEMVATSGNPPQRVLGGIVPFDGSTWFFKLTGPDALVASVKPAFLDFMRTVKAP